jgi:ferric-dicitrate binding protein FerR (iron transport regulator)
MSEQPLSADQERVRALLREARTPEADPVFRTRLREAFVSGRIADAAPAPAAVAPARAAWWRRPLVAWAAVATAALVAVLAVPAMNRAPAWRVVEIRGAGVASVDGRPVTLDHTDQLAAMLRPGARVRLPEGAVISLASAGMMTVELNAGADAVIPGLPGRWFGRASHAEVNRGVMRVATGADFKGARLTIATPAADVEVIGTTLAVICEPVGTCVCVLEGRVKVGRKGEPMEEVGPGHRRFVFLDGTDERAGMRPTEIPELERLRGQD